MTYFLMPKEVTMGEKQHSSHIDNDNDIVITKRRYNDIDIDIVQKQFDDDSLKEKVLDHITEYKLDCLQKYLFGNNKFISDCNAFINPAIKQIERFMYVWMNDLDDETRKIIVQHKMNGFPGDEIPYKYFTNSPLWKYESCVIKTLNNFTCALCEKQYQPTHLVVHHHTYEHIGSELNHLNDVMVLCNDCHMEIHGIRRRNER